MHRSKLFIVVIICLIIATITLSATHSEAFLYKGPDKDMHAVGGLYTGFVGATSAYAYDSKYSLKTIAIFYSLSIAPWAFKELRDLQGFGTPELEDFIESAVFAAIPFAAYKGIHFYVHKDTVGITGRF